MVITDQHSDQSLTPTVPFGDVTYFTRGFSTTSIPSRYSSVIARQAAVTNALALVSSIMSSGDRLYDKRYVWIDARINLETGILVKATTSLADRIKANRIILNSMLKLLAVQ